MKLSIKKIASAAVVTVALVFSGVGIYGGAAYAAGAPCDSDTAAVDQNGNWTGAPSTQCQVCVASNFASTGKWSMEPCKTGGSLGVSGVWTLARQIINWILIAAGIIAIGFIIFAGIRYVTSGGDQEKVKKAKNTLLYAIIGLLIAALAMIIVNLVLNFGSNVVNQDNTGGGGNVIGG